MILKRKRSESELSFTSSSTSTFNSPPRKDCQLSVSFDAAVDKDGLASLVAPRTLLNSRTMKRFRDSRPSDATVYRKFYEWRAHHHHVQARATQFSHATPAERTLDMLYTAQRHQSPVTQQPPVDPVLAQPLPTSQPQRPQTSLHSFWNLPGSAPVSLTPNSNAAPAPSIDMSEPSSCDDCGQALGGAGDDDSMDVDTFDVDVSTSCSVCHKNVCSHCSITSLGEQRRCLMCAGRKVWVGGLGWTTGTQVPVC